MRRRRQTMPGATLLALAWVLLTATPVAAECPFVPPFPPADDAVRSAEEVLIGDLVPVTGAELGIGPEQEREFALRVTEVLRGPRSVGDLVDVQYLEPNWPWAKVNDTEPFPSCSYLNHFAREGDTIALALRAVQPRQRLEGIGVSWIQPRTVYNAMSKVRNASRLSEFRYLAGLPQTDVAEAAAHAPRTSSGLSWVAVLVAGVGAGFAAWYRTGRRT